MRRIARMTVLMMALGLPARAALAETPKASATTPAARLEVHMEGPRLKSHAGKSAYSLVVVNPGGAPAKHVVLRYQVPRSLKVISASDGGKQDRNGRTITWTWAELKPSGFRLVHVRLEGDNGYPCTHSCSASANGDLKAETDFRATQVAPDPLLLCLVDTEDPICVGSTTTYEVRLQNGSPKHFANIRVRATIPPEMELKSITGPVAYHQHGREVIFEPIARLSSREDVVFRIECKAVTIGDRRSKAVRFKATVDADDYPEPIYEYDATRIVDVDR
jgi:hypothetical protein